MCRKKGCLCGQSAQTCQWFAPSAQELCPPAPPDGGSDPPARQPHPPGRPPSAGWGSASGTRGQDRGGGRGHAVLSVLCSRWPAGRGQGVERRRMGGGGSGVWSLPPDAQTSEVWSSAPFSTKPLQRPWWPASPNSKPACPVPLAAFPGGERLAHRQRFANQDEGLGLSSCSASELSVWDRKAGLPHPQRHLHRPPCVASHDPEALRSHRAWGTRRAGPGRGSPPFSRGPGHPG